MAALFLSHTRPTLELLLLTLGMGLVGLIDDMIRVGPKTKLMAQLILAALAVQIGIVYPLTGLFWVNALFTLFWIVGITNSINLLDNMDGLAAGIAIIALAQVVLLAGPSLLASRLAICMLASVAGFLFFNLNPA